MLRIFSVLLIVTAVVLAFLSVTNLYDDNLSVGRMWETPGIRPHERPLPVIDTHSIPIDGGEALLRLSDPQTLKAPFDITRPEIVAAGKIGYGHFCVHCHGKDHDGNGTVGQSFTPLPGDLRGAMVQSQPVGQLWHEISYGRPDGRQPPLASTISLNERWRIAGYILSLGRRPQ
uniref:Cytochrome C oxidase, cbb3-type, subunit III n=1 Tax=Candidatus Kentrum eta TaxID=2126337 RepID=A0A450VT22_9GAMM|nr:MAG: Cytochrome C oxidase, cbb3-type, subunit III [Candidatus Kentron sp. H]